MIMMMTTTTTTTMMIQLSSGAYSLHVLRVNVYCRKSSYITVCWLSARMSEWIPSWKSAWSTQRFSISQENCRFSNSEYLESDCRATGRPTDADPNCRKVVTSVGRWQATETSQFRACGPNSPSVSPPTKIAVIGIVACSANYVVRLSLCHL